MIFFSWVLSSCHFVSLLNHVLSFRIFFSLYTDFQINCKCKFMIFRRFLSSIMKALSTWWPSGSLFGITRGGDDLFTGELNQKSSQVSEERWFLTLIDLQGILRMSALGNWNLRFSKTDEETLGHLCDMNLGTRTFVNFMGSSNGFLMSFMV